MGWFVLFIIMRVQAYGGISQLYVLCHIQWTGNQGGLLVLNLGGWMLN